MEKINNYDWLCSIPQGWEEISRQMISECEAIDSSYQIEDMKEKWGGLRVSSYIHDYEDSDWIIPSCNNKEIETIENKYIEQSRKTCCTCGRPATKISTGWILPWCDKCGKDDEAHYRRFDE